MILYINNTQVYDIIYKQHRFIGQRLTSPFLTAMDISATDRKPEPGDNIFCYILQGVF